MKRRLPNLLQMSAVRYSPQRPLVVLRLLLHCRRKRLPYHVCFKQIHLPRCLNKLSRERFSPVSSQQWLQRRRLYRDGIRLQICLMKMLNQLCSTLRLPRLPLSSSHTSIRSPNHIPSPYSAFHLPPARSDQLVNKNLHSSHLSTRPPLRRNQYSVIPPRP